MVVVFFFQAEDGIRDGRVTGVQTCALPISEDEFSTRTIEPYALMNGREGWYVASFDPAREDVRHFRLDRIKSATVTDERYEPRPEVDAAADIDGWPRTG